MKKTKKCQNNEFSGIMTKKKRDFNCSRMTRKSLIITKEAKKEMSVTKRTCLVWMTRYWHVLSAVAQFAISEPPVTIGMQWHFRSHRYKYFSLENCKWEMRNRWGMMEAIVNIVSHVQRKKFVHVIWKWLMTVLWMLHSAHGNCFLLIKILRRFSWCHWVFAMQQISYDVTKYE